MKEYFESRHGCRTIFNKYGEIETIEDRDESCYFCQDIPVLFCDCIKLSTFIPDDHLEEIRKQFNHGGRTHYIVFCHVCRKTHEWIGEEWGVTPNQPALGWQED